MSETATNPLNALARRVPSSMKEFVHAVGSSVPTVEDLPDDVGTIAGGVVGAVLGRKRGHIMLGAIVGSSAGRNLPTFMMKAGHRRAALVNMGQTGVSALASLAVPKHPVLAFVGTWVASHFVIEHWNLR